MAGPHVAHIFSQVQFSLGKNVPYLSDGASYIEIRVTVCNWEDGPAVASFIHTGDAGSGTGGRARGFGRAVRCAPGLWHGAQAALTQSVMLKPTKHKYLETKIIYATPYSVHTSQTEVFDMLQSLIITNPNSDHWNVRGSHQ